MDQGPPRPGFDPTREAARVRRFAVNMGGRARTMGPFERILFAIVGLIALAFALVLLIPFLVIGLVVALAAIAYVSVRRALSNGSRVRPIAGDGRENVRVVRRDDPR